MDVSCPQCKTLYELDDEQLGDEGATLKCSHCEHLFRLIPDSGVQSESSRRWMIRQSDTGEFLYFTGFDTLHEWIMEGRVDADDAISRTGNSWKKLGEIGEFAPVFQVVESIADISQSRSAQQRPEAKSSSDKSGDQTGLSPTDSKENGDQSSSAELEAPETKRRTETEQDFSAQPGEQEEQSSPSEETDNRPEKEDEAEESDDKWGANQFSNDEEQSEPRLDSEPEVQLEERRFEAGDPEIGNAESESDGWTLGQLEHGTDEDEEFDQVSDTTRRWPAVLMAVVCIGIAAVIWQFEYIEKMTGDVVEDWTGAAVDEDDGVSEDDEVSEDDLLEAAFSEVGDQLRVGLEAADLKTSRQARDEALGRASELIIEGRLQAEEAARHEAQREPTIDEMVAAARRSLDRGNPGRAVDRFEQALEHTPDSAEAMVGLGWAYISDEEPGEAIEHFERARRTDSELGDALIGLARAQRETGRDEAALSTYQEYKTAFPDGDQYSIAEYQSQQLREKLEE